MNVGQLRQALMGLPNDMPVVAERECGWDDDPGVFLMPAHIEFRIYGRSIYEGWSRPPSDLRPYEVEDCRVLMISAGGHNDNDVVELMPAGDGQTVVEGELDRPALTPWPGER